jgi:hypothetical protein
LTQAGPNADLRIEMTGMETCTRFNIAVLDITDGKRRITWSKKMSNRELAPTIRYTFRKIAPIVPGRGTQRSNPGTIYAQVQCFNAVDRPFKSQSNVGTFKVCGKGIVTTLLTRVETALLNLGKPRGASVKFIK